MSLQLVETRILVIADKTCPCGDLHEQVVKSAEGTAADVLIVAPALNSRLRHYLSDTDGAIRAAERRLATAIAELANLGLVARGAVGDADPIQAIDDTLAEFAAHEIVISTHPEEHSHWLERNLVFRARERFEVPITHVVSWYGAPLAAA
ncbi:MAG: hypothetical protein H0U42_07220 [Thermoleophilaceae bacterium]|nr:hypothetical protein [Thermoleophilaceae bacterium]